jgi:hypothetical protein
LRYQILGFRVAVEFAHEDLFLTGSAVIANVVFVGKVLVDHVYRDNDVAGEIWASRSEH